MELEKQLAKVNKEVKAAEKAYRKLGDAANDEALTKAKTQQQLNPETISALLEGLGIIG